MMDMVLNLCLEKDHQGTLLTNCCSKRTGHQRILLTVAHKKQFKVVFRVQKSLTTPKGNQKQQIKEEQTIQ